MNSFIMTSKQRPRIKVVSGTVSLFRPLTQDISHTCLELWSRYELMIIECVVNYKHTAIKHTIILQLEIKTLLYISDNEDNSMKMSMYLPYPEEPNISAKSITIMICISVSYSSQCL